MANVDEITLLPDQTDGPAAPATDGKADGGTDRQDASSVFDFPGTARADHHRPPEVSSRTDVTRSDEQLLSDYLHGDQPAFRLLVERYQRELFHFLARFLGDRAAADDIFQESFLQVHQSAAQFDLSRRFKPWLFTIAANKARDWRRSRARRPTQPLQASIDAGNQSSGEFIDLMEAVQESPAAPMERKELEQLVRQTVADMPDVFREVLLLAYFQQFPYKQIADILGVPLGTVKSRLHSAVAFFASEWKKSNRGRTAS